MFSFPFASTVPERQPEVNAAVSGCRSIGALAVRSACEPEGEAAAGLLDILSRAGEGEPDPIVAVERVEIARQLEKLPQTGAAFANGDVGYQHVAVLARTAEHVGAAVVRKE